MRRFFHLLLSLAALPLLAQAQSATTALTAIKLLPKNDLKRIVRIEAREGAPTPERWYILVHNPKEESGVHEYVVKEGELVASRSLSQFAENAKAEEMVPGETLKIDSDRAGQLAQAYAEANNYVAASFNYQLKKEADSPRAAWTVTCLDQTGKRLGEVVVAAGKGTVVSHSGFPIEPSPDKLEKPKAADPEEDHDSTRTVRKRYVAKYRTAPAQRPPDKGSPWTGLRKLFGGH